MTERSPHIHARPGSERSFGLLIAAVVMAVALYPLLRGGDVRWLPAAVALALMAVALVRPGLLTAPNRLWFRFGLLLGRVVSPVVMLLVYAVAVIPTGLVLRALGKDPLRRARDDHLASYWIERDWPMQPMEDQF